MAQVVDPAQTGSFPVLLGETLREGSVKNLFTTVRYNHRPQALAESTTPTPKKSTIAPTESGSQKHFQLHTADQEGGQYVYTGSRSSDPNQYVLYFDPARKAFILDRIDSTFHMNLSQTPTQSSTADLQRQYPQIDPLTVSSSPSPVTSPSPEASPDTTSTLPSHTNKASRDTLENKDPQNKETRNIESTKIRNAKDKRPVKASRSAAKPKVAKPPPKIALPSAPTPLPADPKPSDPLDSTSSLTNSHAIPSPTVAPKPAETHSRVLPSRNRNDSDSEEEESDGDDALLVEYPGQEQESKKSTGFVPDIIMRPFSDFIRESDDYRNHVPSSRGPLQHQDSDEADGEEEEEGEDDGEEDEELEDVPYTNHTSSHPQNSHLSPYHSQSSQGQNNHSQNSHSNGPEEDDDGALLIDDLEAELAATMPVSSEQHNYQNQQHQNQNYAEHDDIDDLEADLEAELRGNSTAPPDSESEASEAE